MHARRPGYRPLLPGVWRGDRGVEVSRQAFVLAVGMSDSTVPEQIRLSIQHWLDTTTDEQIVEGIVTWPDAEGDTYLLPVVVQR